MTCEHSYQFQGVVYGSGYALPGSGAQERVYWDRYFCTKCLEVRDTNNRVQGTTYSKPIEGTMPK